MRRVSWRRFAAWAWVWGALGLVLCQVASAQGTVLEFSYTPVTRAQVALWIEDADGNYLATVALTEAVAYRGIGNRAGASQMNSGYRWPYGRREGVLPVWARRRAAQFPRVVYQDRPEGWASRMRFDQSPDTYYCLQFDPTHSTRDELDAVSCATQFNGDKGRYLTPADVANGYAEPWQDPAGKGSMRPLPLFSRYPPRMDVSLCQDERMGCYDHDDVARYVADTRAAMPEIDSVTKATPPGEVAQTHLYSVPPSWPAGEYRALIEVNVEGDYNDHWSSARDPTPMLPENAWDPYAYEWGYAYRGQPSIVFAVDFTLGPKSGEFSTAAPEGRSSWQVWDDDYGELENASDSASDPDGLASTGGSGIDRLRANAAGQRFSVSVRPPVSTSAEPVVGPIRDLTLQHHPNKLRSHTWVQMRFLAATSEAPLHEYEVRVATEPMVDEATFLSAGRPAKNATDSAEGATALMLPVDTPAGQVIQASIGDLVAKTHYWIGVRGTDAQNHHGPIAVAEITTTAREFQTVTPCFIATAAYGSPLAREVSVLRRLRDRQLLALTPGRPLVAAYYALSPTAAEFVARSPWLRAITRTLLWPLTAAAGRMP